ncbi:MAG: hypothetical protein ACRETC_03905 [Gammaproteobacteria bacterium]
MSTTHRFLIIVASAGLTLGTASGAYAFMQSGAAHANSEPATTFTVAQNTTQLSPIVVNGQRIDFPLVLQIIKTALHRPWSGSRADRNKLVCGFVDKLGTQFKRLSCMTNAAHFKRQDATQISRMNSTMDYSVGAGESSSKAMYQALENGQIPLSVANWTNNHWINRGALLTLLNKLPPVGSSYTMRITEHGKPVVDYVIKDGELAAIHRYIYKNEKKQN